MQRTMAELRQNELQPGTRDRKVSRKSWSEVYSETTALRIHKMLLGQEVELDDGFGMRIKLAQQGAAVLFLLALSCWVANQIIATIVLGAIGFVFLAILYYKNASFCDYETIVARSQRGDYCHVSSVQL